VFTLILLIVSVPRLFIYLLSFQHCYLEGPYEFCPVEGDNGSCVHYSTRTLLNKNEISGIAYDKIFSEYGDTLVLVASPKERWSALVPHLPYMYQSQLTTIHYCILELIGKARENVSYLLRV
jgi:hypothetical protein